MNIRSVPSQIRNLFLSYVKINTQANPDVKTSPSSPGQLILGDLLVSQLKEWGITDAHRDEFGYVYATVPANVAYKVPVICFCAHLDTAPDCSGENVKPIVHENYQGLNIIFPDNPAKILNMIDHPELQKQIGCDVITASGNTLLGSDDKSGIAAIMDAVYYLTQDPNAPAHGEIKILFTPDEEIGRGTQHVDLQKLGAEFAYTLDGGKVGSLDIENFNACGAVLTIQGVAAHPGYAKDKMENATKIAAKIAAALPNELSPETTEKREGFIYILNMQGSLETATVTLILRDFDNQRLKDLCEIVEQTSKEVMKGFPHSQLDIKFTDQYKNMKEVLDQHPLVVKNARKAILKAGVSVIEKPIRGGTDGTRLSFMGLPCPNLFAGEHGIHSIFEWTSVQDMDKASEVISNLCAIWAIPAEE